MTTPLSLAFRQLDGPPTDAPVIPSFSGDLRQFMREANPRYRWYRHVEILGEALEAVAERQMGRLMVFMPPRHGKSELVSRVFPAYLLAKHPDRWVGLCSYESTLAQDFSRVARDAYLRTGGQMRTDSSAVHLWQTTQRGGMWAAGVGGPITGKGFHVGIIDDPLKNDEEAQSETIRQKHKSWYESTFVTREEPEAAQIIVQTRWHEDDLSGWLLSRERDDLNDDSERWHIVNFPAIAEETPAVFPVSCTVAPDWRQPGDALCPPRYDAAKLAKTQRRVGSRVWEALYQQRPTAAAGVIFKRKWWQFYTTREHPIPDVPTLPVMTRAIISWDMAFKDTDGSDYVSGQVWGREGVRFYLLDRIKERLSFTATCSAVLTMKGKWPSARGTYIEDKANGTAVMDKLSRTVPGIIAVEPDGGKISRAYAVQPLVEAGNVFLPHPEIAPWVEDFIRELAAFPNGTHDDDVDACTQALNVLDPGAREPVPVVLVDPHDPRIMAEQGNPTLGTIRKLQKRDDLKRRARLI